MSRYSSDFVTAVATIAAQAAGVLGPKDAVEFAWFSVQQVGDASVDQNDYDRHLAAWQNDGSDH